MKNLRARLISQPKITQNQLTDVTFDRHQGLGGAKASITAIRRQIDRYINLGIIAKNDMAYQIGFRTPILTRFIKASNIDIADAILIDKYFTNERLERIRKALRDDKLAKAKIQSDAKTFKHLKKDNIRELLISHIANNRTKGKFFGFPSSDCHFEFKLNTLVDNDFHYIGVECERDIFMKMKKKSVNLYMDCIKAYSHEVIPHYKSDTFSHMFLDYCGTFPTFENEIKFTLDNDLVKQNGLIGLTFSTRENNIHTQASKVFHKSIIDALGLVGEPNVKDGIRIKLLSMLGTKYRLIEFESYFTNQDMVFALIQRIG
jgi:hypothetical protein